jgi:UDP-GlcNAc:undecaprenyl-phosphate GlcNAc-1-phosphate transferase
VSVFTLVLVFFASLILTAGSVAFSIKIAHRWKIYDHPDMPRKTQENPVPKLGGLAVAIAFLVVTLAYFGLAGRGSDLELALGVLIPAALMATLGFVDDRRHLNPYLRLVVQAGLAALVGATGTRVDVTGFVLVDFVLFVFWVMLIVNGINLLDNSDGLAASTTLVGALGAGVIAVLSGQDLVSAFAIALAGAALGFLWHNWHPARVYLGDAGAYFLGFMLAVLVVRLRPDKLDEWQGLVVALLLVALPLLDTVFVITRRLRAGVHPFTAGRDHLSHQLQERGSSIRLSVVQLQSISIVSVLLAVLLVVAAW